MPRNVTAPDELITCVIIPLPSKNDIFKLYKVSRRKDLDISAFTAAAPVLPVAPKTTYMSSLS